MAQRFRPAHAEAITLHFDARPDALDSERYSIIKDRRLTGKPVERLQPVTGWPSSRDVDLQATPPPKRKAIAENLGGADRDRTDDLRLAKPALSQLSYSPEKACRPILPNPGSAGSKSHLSSTRLEHPTSAAKRGADGGPGWI